MDKSSIKNIIKLISVIQISLSISFLIPLLTGLIYKEDIKQFLMFDIGSFFLNFMILILLRKHKVSLTIKEGILSVNLIWLMLGFMGAFPIIFATNISLSSAFFETISGFTTTGASVFSDITNLPKHILMLRSVFHWLGGMGIIVLGVGLYSLINPCGSMTLFKAESTGVATEKLTPRIKDTAIRLWQIYMLITALDGLFLYLAGMNVFDSINHALSTISTGGFSTKTESLGFYKNNWVVVITTFFMIVSGVNFLAHLKSLSGDFSGYKTSEFRTYLKLFVIISIILTVVHYYNSNDGISQSLIHSSFTIASILTTTGFMTVDYGGWGNFAIAILFIPMFIGGSAGSTAGGVKVVRYIILLKVLAVEIKRILSPSSIFKVSMNKVKLKDSIVSSVVGFFILYAISNIILSLYLFARGHDMLTAISASLAIIGNIGPGFGHVGPVNNYAIFNWFDQIILSIFMIVGRLEFYTVIIVFSKKFWTKF